MSNYVYLESVKFVNPRDENDVSYGCIIGDDYFNTFIRSDNKGWIEADGVDLLEKAIAAFADSDEVTELLSYLVENEQGMAINGVFHAYEDIRSCLD